MPYKYAYLLLGLVLVVTIIGFWPTYFSIIDDVPFAFHAHAFTATAWIILVGFQSWSIHHGARVLHRKVGIFSLLLFPLLIASFVMIINVSASRFLKGDSQFWQQFGPIFGYIMVTAITAYLVLFFQALRHRRNVYLHAGYMLATPFMLWEASFGRVLNQYVPSFQIEGPAELHKVMDAIVISDMMAVALASFLYLRNRKHGTPFLVVAALLLAQIGGIYLLDEALWLRELFTSYGQLSQEATVGTGFVLGALVAWLGWTKPFEPQGLLSSRQ